jgi:hypothetical protein
MFYAEFRARARKSLSGKWISMTFIHFIYVMLNGIFSGIALFGGVLLGLAALNNANKISLFDNWAKDIDRATELILKEAYGSDYEEVVYRFIQSTAKTMSDIIPVLIVIIIIAIVYNSKTYNIKTQNYDNPLKDNTYFKIPYNLTVRYL